MAVHIEERRSNVHAERGKTRVNIAKTRDPCLCRPRVDKISQPVIFSP